MRGPRLYAVGIFLTTVLLFPAVVLAQLAPTSELLLSRIEALEQRVGELENTVAAQQELIARLQDRLGDLVNLKGFIRVETGTINGLPGPHIIFEGANVHIRNGNRNTATYDCDPAG
ncbi:MAG TPA: hypothetical protein VNK81_03070, partial [Thermodesulfobacteriota bacterium]|nr:hypothetical protein [Thermodesulfobacteriota bacterium]